MQSAMSWLHVAASKHSSSSGAVSSTSRLGRSEREGGGAGIVTHVCTCAIGFPLVVTPQPASALQLASKSEQSLPDPETHVSDVQELAPMPGARSPGRETTSSALDVPGVVSGSTVEAQPESAASAEARRAERERV